MNAQAQEQQPGGVSHRDPEAEEVRKWLQSNRKEDKWDQPAGQAAWADLVSEEDQICLRPKETDSGKCRKED